ncbi:hypothetical protein PIB30_090172 [Stylosanthes scabra]|uniref:Uncharacterized protein n=1 Tax=Stylosanthes scabra TaxID=79078 RepID=A0ABU6XU07_9FABA|nr:hypothetical protein [Stylosanthes scabra]
MVGIGADDLKKVFADKTVEYIKSDAGSTVAFVVPVTFSPPIEIPLFVLQQSSPRSRTNGTHQGSGRRSCSSGRKGENFLFLFHDFKTRSKEFLGSVEDGGSGKREGEG